MDSVLKTDFLHSQIVGWFILDQIQLVSLSRARRQEMIIRGTNDRGLGTGCCGKQRTPTSRLRQRYGCGVMVIRAR